MKGIDLIIYQKNKKEGGTDFPKQTGYTVLVSDKMFSWMIENEEKVGLVDCRVPDVYYNGKAFAPREDRQQSSGSSKY